MHEKDSNIAHICTSRQNRPGELTIEMILEVTSPRHLVRILHQIEALVNVRTVRSAPTSPDVDRPMGAFNTPFE